MQYSSDSEPLNWSDIFWPPIIAIKIVQIHDISPNLTPTWGNADFICQQLPPPCWSLEVCSAAVKRCKLA